MTPTPRVQWTRVLLILAGLVTWSCPALAVDTYEDLPGRFLIDLPDGYSDQQSQHEDNFHFTREGDGPQVVMAFLEGESDTAATFQESVDAVKSSITNAQPVELLRMKINGHPARWGRLEGSVTVSDQTVPLYAVTGAVTLEQGGLYFLVILNDLTRDEWEPRLREVFESIREIGEPVTGASDIQPVD